jgi:hypothetical protein
MALLANCGVRAKFDTALYSAILILILSKLGVIYG